MLICPGIKYTNLLTFPCVGYMELPGPSGSHIGLWERYCAWNQEAQLFILFFVINLEHDIFLSGLYSAFMSKEWDRIHWGRQTCTRYEGRSFVLMVHAVIRS